MISLNRNNNGGIKFLIIEEDPFLSFLVRAELKKFFSIKWLDVASSSSEGLDLANYKEYDLLIVNYDLPDIDGLSLWFRLKRGGLDLPAVLAIRDSDEEQSLIQLKSDQFDFVLKDDEYPASLIPALRRLLESNRKSYIDAILHKTQTEEEWLDALSQTSIAVNHEINNPLTTIIGTTELLIKGNYDLDHKTQSKIAIIQESAHRIKDILIQLGHISKPISVDIPGGRMIDIRESSRGVPESSRIPSKITIKR